MWSAGSPGFVAPKAAPRTDFKEIEERDHGLIKLNPILLFKEREVWQYLALYNVKSNPLYGAGYRSLGCSPCTLITTDDNERAGRWLNTSKCGGECGIHTQPLKAVTNVDLDAVVEENIHPEAVTAGEISNDDITDR